MIFRSLLVLLLGLTLSAGAWAGGYRVEVVIFAYDPPQTRELLIPTQAPALSPEAVDPGAGDGTFRAVPLSASMSGIADQLRRSHGYRVLATQAWVQPALGPGRARPVHVTGTSTGARLDGTVRLVARRFLHVTTDLIYTPAAQATSESEAAAAPESYRIVGKRRMRLGEIHYLDHPQVGVLVTVERAD